MQKLVDIPANPPHEPKQLLHIRSGCFPNLCIADNLPHKFAGGNPGFLRLGSEQFTLGFGESQLKPAIFNTLLAYRNKLIAQGRDTDAVDEVMIYGVFPMLSARIVLGQVSY